MLFGDNPVLLLQEKQKGVIGLSADLMCYEPMSAKQEDIDAVMRLEEFDMGW